MQSAIGVGDSSVNKPNTNMSFIHETINFGMLPEEKEKVNQNQNQSGYNPNFVVEDRYSNHKEL